MLQETEKQELQTNNYFFLFQQNHCSAGYPIKKQKLTTSGTESCTEETKHKDTTGWQKQTYGQNKSEDIIYRAL